jgi:hypothetical protein
MTSRTLKMNTRSKLHKEHYFLRPVNKTMIDKMFENHQDEISTKFSYIQKKYKKKLV